MSLNILSIDGGGTRGVIPATILDCIYRDFGKSPLDLFDLFAGTSTGAIISIGLAAGLKPAELLDLYLNKAGDIFYETVMDQLQPVDEYFVSNYQNDRFKNILQKMFGDKTLGDLHNDPNFGGKGKHLMVCSFNLSPDDKSDRNKNYRPEIFNSSFIRCAKVKLVDLALMTSAGPTYFPIYHPDNSNGSYVDGGVALNNPSMAALTFAINGHNDGVDYLYPDGKMKGLNLKFADLQLFSLSTGTGNQNRIERSAVGDGNWGKLHWIRYLPDLITETNMQSTIYYVKQVLNDDQLHRVELFFDDDNAPAILKEKPVGLDAKNLEVLKAMHQFAIDTYNGQKEAIANFLRLPYSTQPLQVMNR